MWLAEVTITVECRALAEAARFVFESAGENEGPNTEVTEAGSTEGAEQSGHDLTAVDGAGGDVGGEGQLDEPGQAGAQHAAALQAQGEPTESEFVKGKRRKKAA